MERLPNEIIAGLLTACARLPATSFSACSNLGRSSKALYSIYKYNVRSLCIAHLVQSDATGSGLILLRLAAIIPDWGTDPQARSINVLGAITEKEIEMEEKATKEVTRIMEEGERGLVGCTEEELLHLISTLEMLRSIAVAVHRGVNRYDKHCREGPGLDELNPWQSAFAYREFNTVPEEAQDITKLIMDSTLDFHCRVPMQYFHMNPLVHIICELVMHNLLISRALYKRVPGSDARLGSFITNQIPPSINKSDTPLNVAVKSRVRKVTRIRTIPNAGQRLTRSRFNLAVMRAQSTSS